MKRSRYRERDYAFGQVMLTLRTSIGLTQAGLGQRLRVSQRAVAEWEGGLSYPTADHLKALIALGVQQRIFASGREAEEIRTLWRAAHQKVLLDGSWLHEVLNQQTRDLPAVSNSSAGSGPRVDWGDALDVPTFYGREEEMALLSRWVGEQLIREPCRRSPGVPVGGWSPVAVTIPPSACGTG